MKKTILWLSLVALILSSCSEPKYDNSKVAYILFKTPTFKFADMGFIYQSKDESKLQIYSNGKAIMSLRVKRDSVCMSSFKCMSKEMFNKMILSSSYPKDLLSHILKAQPIFDKIGIRYNTDGFTQTIKRDGKYDIEYSVDKEKIEFIDTLNRVKIKIDKDI
jgi:hypothetical protein